MGNNVYETGFTINVGKSCLSREINNSSLTNEAGVGSKSINPSLIKEVKITRLPLVILGFMVIGALVVCGVLEFLR